MQAATLYLPAGQLLGNDSFASRIRPRLTWSNAIRLALATMAVVAIPLDLDHRVFSPAPNWPLVAIEPVVLIGFLRCTLASIR